MSNSETRYFYLIIDGMEWGPYSEDEILDMEPTSRFPLVTRPVKEGDL